MKKNHQTKPGVLIFSLIIIGVFVLSSCAPAPTSTPAPTQDVALIQTQSAQTVVADFNPECAPCDTSSSPYSGAYGGSY